MDQQAKHNYKINPYMNNSNASISAKNVVPPKYNSINEAIPNFNQYTVNKSEGKKYSYKNRNIN